MTPTETHGSARAEVSQEWIARAHALKPLLEAAAPRIEATCSLPADVLDALHEAKMFRMLLPRSLGGAELDLATYAQVVAVIAEGDGSVAWCIGQNSGCSMAAAYLEPDAARDVFGDPRAVVAWGFSLGPHCRAVPVEGGWMVNGSWGFGSGNRHSQWLGAHCQQCDAAGTPLKHPDGRVTERTMLLPRVSAKIPGDQWDVIGLRGTGSDTYSVTDLYVPAKYSLVPRAVGRDQQLAAGVKTEPEPERREKGTLYRITTMNVYQCGFASVGIGIARATLAAFIALATRKTPSGTTLSLRDDNWIQSRVAQCEAKLSAANAWLVQLAREAWNECEATGEVGFELRIRLRLASTFAIHQAREVVDTAYTEAGTTSIFQSNPFERRMRDMHTVSQQVQASVSHFQSVGQHFLGAAPSVRFI